MNRVVAADELADATRELAERLARGPTLAHGAAKAAVYASANLPFESLLDFEARNQRVVAVPPTRRKGSEPSSNGASPSSAAARAAIQGASMERYDGPLFDSDNHYYEAQDAFMRYVPRRMQKRCVQWVEMDGKRRHLGAGTDITVPATPTFIEFLQLGVARITANPGGKTFYELIRSKLEPLPPEYMDRDARVARVEAQGLDGAWLFPTAGVLYEQAMSHDIEALCVLTEGFNRWLDEDWALTYQGRLFCAPYLTLADVDWACRELEWALERDARVLVMRPSPILTRDGWRSPCDERFDPFWARVNEAGITVVAHVGSTGYTANGYGGNSAIDALGGGASQAWQG